MNLGLHISTNLRGRVRCQVLDCQTKRIKRDYGWRRNLILNNGLDMLASGAASAAGGFSSCAIGTGTRPTLDDSGVTTAEQSGSTVTLSGGAFVFTGTSVDSGNTIKWDSGQEAMIVSVTNSSTATVDRTQSVPAGTFSVYRTNQNQLQTELYRVGNAIDRYLIQSGYTETVFDLPNGSAALRRTFDFLPETSPHAYWEVGLSNTTAPGALLFSRILLPSAIDVAIGEQMRVIYELIINVNPHTVSAKNITISGIGEKTGVAMFETWPTSYVSNATGLTVDSVDVRWEPIIAPHIWVSSNTDDLRVTMDSSTYTRSGSFGKAVTFGSYAGKSFVRTGSVTFLTSEANFAIACLGIGLSSGSNAYPVYTLKLDSPFTKLNTKTLSLDYTWSYSRTLG